ncbi:MAG: tripartite tricarboxylate transporter substrate binding protein [Rhodospirillales bacterium]|jgi:tripartite-type tricarboxylate transporter receptor subunit TctC|nr:tripartite tricarboxylate transporter substrate binding protein [Rhodospirillales bacterium]
MKFKSVAKTLGVAAAAVGMVAVSYGTALAKYPERPIQIIIPWGAGGGTDATGRMIGTILKKYVGVPVNVVNRTGGQGVVGHSAIANAKADGYTLGVATVEIAMMHWVGLTKLTSDAYTPIGLYNVDPAGVQVNADSPWNSAQDMIDAMKANPGKYKGSGTSQGGIWHLALAGMLQAAGVDSAAAPWVPSKGAAPGLKELVADGVAVVTCSPTEAGPLANAGKVKILAAMSDERMGAFPDVPTLKEQGIDWALGAWRSFVGPKGMPQEAIDVLVPAFAKVVKDPDFVKFMNKRGFQIVYRDPAGLKKWYKQADKDMGGVLKAVGLVK